MPHIEIKTSQKLNIEEKESLCEKLTKAFAKSSNPAVAKNIQFVVEDGLFIRFRGDSSEHSANVQLHPGPLTPKEDYEGIVNAFFPILIEALSTSQDRIYITISEIQYWGFNGELVKINLNK